MNEKAAGQNWAASEPTLFEASLGTDGTTPPVSLGLSLARA